MLIEIPANAKKPRGSEYSAANHHELGKARAASDLSKAHNRARQEREKENNVTVAIDSDDEEPYIDSRIDYEAQS